MQKIANITPEKKYVFSTAVAWRKPASAWSTTKRTTNISQNWTTDFKLKIAPEIKWIFSRICFKTNKMAAFNWTSQPSSRTKILLVNEPSATGIRLITFYHGSMRTTDGMRALAARPWSSNLISSWRGINNPPFLHSRPWSVENLAPQPSQWVGR